MHCSLALAVLLVGTALSARTPIHGKHRFYARQNGTAPVTSPAPAPAPLPPSPAPPGPVPTGPPSPVPPPPKPTDAPGQPPPPPGTPPPGGPQGPPRPPPEGPGGPLPPPGGPDGPSPPPQGPPRERPEGPPPPPGRPAPERPQGPPGPPQGPKEDRPNAPPALRILALGASVTFGLGSSTGSSYRLALRNLLLRQSSGPGGAGPDGLGGVAFPDVNYVGTVRAGRAQGFLDNDCECFSGDVISQLADRGTTAATMFKPNVVLVEVGTNNCNSGRLVPDARANATALIEELLDDSSPGAVAVLATLIVNPVPEQEACRLDVNTQYRQAVADLQRRDRKVLLADMRVPAPGTRDTALSVSDLADGRHPNDFGYNKMANIWYSAILDARDRGWLVDAVAVDGILADGNAGRVEGETAGNGGAMRGISGTNGNGSSVDSDGTGRAGGGGVLLSGGDDDTVIVSGQGPRIPGVGTASAGERLRASVGAAAVGLVVMGLMAL